MQLTDYRIDSLTTATKEHSQDLLLFIVAFDGALAQFQANPSQVRLTPRRRSLLKHLHQAGIRVGIMSGRRVEDLQRRTGLGSDMFYIGLHGLEIRGPDFEQIRQDVIDAYRDRLFEIFNELRPILEGVRGVNLEFKDAVVALHTRNAGSDDAIWSRFQLLNSAAELLRSGAVRVIRGHDVLEVLPNVGSSRANAIVRIRQFLEKRHRTSVFTVYLGADSTDDDAFEALSGRGMGVVVGRRPANAEFHMPISDVDEFLETLPLGARRSRS